MHFVIIVHRPAPIHPLDVWWSYREAGYCGKFYAWFSDGLIVGMHELPRCPRTRGARCSSVPSRFVHETGFLATSLSASMTTHNPFVKFCHGRFSSFRCEKWLDIDRHLSFCPSSIVGSCGEHSISLNIHCWGFVIIPSVPPILTFFRLTLKSLSRFPSSPGSTGMFNVLWRISLHFVPCNAFVM